MLPLVVVLGLLLPFGSVAVGSSGTQQLDLANYPIQRLGADIDDGTLVSRASSNASISADGRFVVFNSNGALTPGSTGQFSIYIYDRESDALEYVNISTGPDPVPAYTPAISADGRFVVFSAEDTPVVPDDTNGYHDIIRYDRTTQEFVLVSAPADGGIADDSTWDPAISADGSVIAFETAAALTADDDNELRDVFVADLNAGTLERIGGSDGLTDQVSLSSDGGYVAFRSHATDLVEGDVNESADVFVLDRETQAIELISVADGGVQSNNASETPSLSSDGQVVVYVSEASNLTADPAGRPHVILRNRQSGTQQLVDLNDLGELADGESTLSDFPDLRDTPGGRVISDDHRYVVFTSTGSNLPGASDSQYEDRFVYRRDLETGVTELVSRSIVGIAEDFHSSSPTLSADGKLVVFTSESSNLTYFDDNATSDIFIRDMDAAFPPVPFDLTHARTDFPVANGQAQRTWTWAPEPFTEVFYEPYGHPEISNVLPAEMRAVQYFDKARMEVSHPADDPGSVWYVTNGLLVMEMITGRLQTGDDQFLSLDSARVNVAGDADDPDGPTYATFAGLLDAAPHPTGEPVSARLDRSGNVTNDPALAAFGVEVALVDDVTGHAIVAPFWEFMNSSGIVWDGQAFVQDQLFENAYFATGRPVTEAYWATVMVGGTERDVLMQCFERRCLTYTPGNPQGFIVEAGNVGLHYYNWRYRVQPLAPDLPGAILYTDGIYLNILNREGLTEVLQAPAGSEIVAPTWSPDGAQIAYILGDDFRGGELHIVDSDGNNPHALITGENLFAPDWSPDGNKLVFTSGETGDTIETINVDGTGRTAIGSGLHPAWSPQGDRIAYISAQPNAETLRVDETLTTMAPDGSDIFEVISIASTPDIAYGGIDDFAWSPDGARFVFSAEFRPGAVAFRRWEMAIVSVDGSGGQLVPLRNWGGPHLGWTPDGGQVTFSRQNVIYAIELDGGSERGLLWDFGLAHWEITDYEWHLAP